MRTGAHQAGPPPEIEQLAERLRVEGYVVDLAADGEERAFYGGRLEFGRGALGGALVRVWL